MTEKLKSTYTSITAGFMMINYAVGTGMLNLPHTVAKASIFTSFILILTVTAATVGTHCLTIRIRSKCIIMGK